MFIATRRVLGQRIANDITGDISPTAMVQIAMTVCGNFNTSGNVELDDFTKFTLCFDGGSSCPIEINADLDNDGDVNLIDYAAMLNQLTGP